MLKKYRPKKFIFALKEASKPLIVGFCSIVAYLIVINLKGNKDLLAIIILTGTVAFAIATLIFLDRLKISIRKIIKNLFFAFLISIPLLFATTPFLIQADSLPDSEKASVGGTNMWRIVVIYGIFTFIINFLCFLRKKLRLLSSSFLLYWILGTSFVLLINSSNLGSASQQGSSPSVNVDYSKCNEQEALVKAKNCSYPINTDLVSGSGFSIVNGYIITNFHVVEGAKKINTFGGETGEEELNANLWGYSEKDDIAIIKIDKNTNICDWSDSDKIPLAETVFAVGWPLGMEGESSITKGTYSRKVSTKEGPTFIQTDTPINPGNSGGPLVSKCGIVGINEKKMSWSDEQTPTEGLGFSIASNYAKKTVDDLVKNGKIYTLPVSQQRQYKYTPQQENNNDGSANNSYTGYDVPGWVNARDKTREMLSYWNGSSAGGYDQGKVATIKDLLIRMSSVVENIVPKIEQGKSLTSEENRLLAEWNSMLNKVTSVINDLTKKNYNSSSSYFPPKYYYVCENMACVMKQGEGTTNCYISSDCYHYTCQSRSCAKVAGKGTNECYSDYSCSHGECKDGACVQVEGSGTNQCYSDYSCSHSECQNKSCVKVNTPGTTTCYSDYSCQ